MAAQQSNAQTIISHLDLISLGQKAEKLNHGRVSRLIYCADSIQQMGSQMISDSTDFGGALFVMGELMTEIGTELQDFLDSITKAAQEKVEEAQS